MFSQNKNGNKGDVWARPGMQVVFRAELMPKLSREERTFFIKEIMTNGSVTLHNFPGEHFEGEFEPFQFNRQKKK